MAPVISLRSWVPNATGTSSVPGSDTGGATGPHAATVHSATESNPADARSSIPASDPIRCDSALQNGSGGGAARGAGAVSPLLHRLHYTSRARNVIPPGVEGESSSA